MVKLTSDGRRQITAFYLSGDMFGLEAEVAHRFSAEAFDASDIMIIRRGEFQAQGAGNPQFMLMLWEQTVAQLRRAQDHMVLLGRRNAQERVAAFLLDLADRLSNDAINIAMSRLDIADYLGLTIETVSRTLTQFQRDRLIFMPATRLIVLRDRSALSAISPGARRCCAFSRRPIRTASRDACGVIAPLSLRVRPTRQIESGLTYHLLQKRELPTRQLRKRFVA